MSWAWSDHRLTRALRVMQVQPTAQGARNFSQCDSMLIGDNAGANTYPYIQVGMCGSLCGVP